MGGRAYAKSPGAHAAIRAETKHHENTFLGTAVGPRAASHTHDQLLNRNVQRFRGGLVFKAFVSLKSRLESNKDEMNIQVRNVQMGGRA